MPYALIPDGYKLKKVTQLQKQAVNDKRRHDDVKTFLGNQNTPLLLGAGGLVFFIPLIIKLFLKFAEEEGEITPEQNLKLSLLFPVLPIASGAEKLFPGALRLDDLMNFFKREKPDDSTTPPVRYDR